MIVQCPKGTRDILPEEVHKWQYVGKMFAQVCGQFGYKEIRIPTFEHTELFQRGVGDETDIVQKEMYTFNDKGGRSITLRPEGTAGVVRSFIQNGMASSTQPVKLFYDITSFRYEKMQKGRYREFHQLGVEAFGAASPSADIEVIGLCQTFFEKLGFTNISLSINSIGCPTCRKEYNGKLKTHIASVLDKLCDTCKSRYERNPLRILDCKVESCRENLQNVPALVDNLCAECKEHFEQVKRGLDRINIKYQIDKSIVRGLDYYTKTVFEFVTSGVGTQGTVCGGGRYDNLVEVCGGSPTAGIGFALGLERLLLIMQAQDVFVPEPEKVALYVATIGEEANLYAEKLVYGLRKKSNLRIEKDIMSRSLKAQMKYADKIGAQYCLVLGEEELKNGLAKLIHMKKEDIKERKEYVCRLIEDEIIQNIL